MKTRSEIFGRGPGNPSFRDRVTLCQWGFLSLRYKKIEVDASLYGFRLHFYNFQIQVNVEVFSLKRLFSSILLL